MKKSRNPFFPRLVCGVVLSVVVMGFTVECKVCVCVSVLLRSLEDTLRSFKAFQKQKTKNLKRNGILFFCVSACECVREKGVT